MARNRQQATGSRQQAAGNRQQAAGSRHQASERPEGMNYSPPAARPCSPSVTYGIAKRCRYWRSSSSVRATYTTPLPNPTTRLFGLRLTFLTRVPLLSKTS